MGVNGGARPGAGRKPKAEKYATEIGTAERRICDRLPELIDNLFALARGVTVESEGGGTASVYSRPPDRQANEYLINRILGRPTERTEVTGKDGGPVKAVDVSLLASLDALDDAELDALERIGAKIAPAGASGTDPGADTDGDRSP